MFCIFARKMTEMMMIIKIIIDLFSVDPQID